ncbi:MAG: glycosyltransferase family 4 protein [Crocinitomicaceae bacterium]
MSTIAVFHPSSDLYGSDRILVNALNSIPKEVNKQVYLLSAGPLVKHLYNNVENINVEVSPQMPVIYRKIFTLKGIITFLITWFKFISFVKKENKFYEFDSVYVNTLSNTFILPILKFLRIRCFLHVHEIVVNPRLIGKLTAFLAKTFADQIICVSKAVANNLINYSKKAKYKIVVIHNGINSIETKEKEDNENMSFYLFGRIMPQKGQWLVIDALSKLPKEKLKYTSFTFMGGVLYDQTKVLDELKLKIHNAGLEDFIKFEEFATDISEAMSKADVCLIPSTILDSFPTTVLEAMSASKTVIATNQGGAKEAILDQVTGLLFKHNNADDLARKIEKLIDNSTLVKQMGNSAKSHFRTNFTFDIFKANWASFMAKNQHI